ncbi:hypothetical protein I302_102273 [Kwoniella bestiolae CBS 10118]|uniref:Uncharacterized protein n=1 Tax=Kwoniella bestiolae CBS 10118 TaxID=1296100 RepID=A0A1B9GEM0_9TREE|nr:hypothetical protein I302_00965 [Kwoniella bestiolae CBS 10118]OCF29460.1 hypothetical protein I302_00965 [Kwoniella bestiolae CBS 10118]
MPPKGSGKPRHSSPLKPTRKSSKTPAKKARASEPAPQGGKRKATDESDHEEKGKRGKGRKKGKVDEEEEEEEEEAEVVELGDSEGEEDEKEDDKEVNDSQEVFKEISSKLHSKSKRSRKSGKKEPIETKELKKLDKMYDDVHDMMKQDDIVQVRQQTISDLFIKLKGDLDLEQTKKTGELIETRTHRCVELYNYYQDLANNYHEPLIGALGNAIRAHEGRTQSIGKTIKEFTKIQKEKIKENEEMMKSALDPQKMVHGSRELMLSVLRNV